MANTLNLGNGNWATKEDSLLAYNSENGNFKPLPFDFARASSATVVNKAGLIETVGSGEPRIDFSNDAKGALLLEPTRSNLIPYSEDMSNWAKGGFMNVVSNQIISPDGNLNADKLTSNSNGSNYANINSTFAANNGVSSIFLKSGTLTQAMIYHGGSAKGVYVDLTNGEFLSFYSSGAGLTFLSEYYGNGWYRYSISDTSTSTSALEVYLAKNQQITTSYTTNDYLYAWGGQYEQQGSYATSYIPTSGSAVTRIADSSSQTPPSGIIGQTEGIAYVEIDWKGNNEESIFSVLHDGTVNNRMDFGYSAVFNSFYFNVRTGGSGQGLMQYASPTIGKYKVAISYKNNDFALWVNGVKEALDSSGSVPVTTQYNVGNYIGGGREHSIINSKLYNTALTDAELISLTKI